MSIDICCGSSIAVVVVLVVVVVVVVVAGFVLFVFVCIRLCRLRRLVGTASGDTNRDVPRNDTSGNRSDDAPKYVAPMYILAIDEELLIESNARFDLIPSEGDDRQSESAMGYFPRGTDPSFGFVFFRFGQGRTQLTVERLDRHEQRYEQSDQSVRVRIRSEMVPIGSVGCIGTNRRDGQSERDDCQHDDQYVQRLMDLEPQRSGWEPTS